MILDTNALSALADGDSALITILSSAIRHEVPAIVIGEYRYGVQRAKHRRERERWLDEIEIRFEILEVTKHTARVYALIRGELRKSGKPIPENDIWIAALAREHGFELLTRDRNFDSVPGIKRRWW